jgi:hypothetical protein
MVMMPLRERAHEIIESISEKKIAEVIDFLEYLKIKEEIEATNEILDDKKLMESIQKGLRQVENNEVYDLKDVIDNV